MGKSKREGKVVRRGDMREVRGSERGVRREEKWR